MGKTLIIAEKPSVAADIVRCLPGKFTKTKTHYEGEAHIVSFALGHLVTIGFPDAGQQKWTFEHLPILPEEFPLAVLPDTKSQFLALKKLIKSKEVDTLVNACDAGREGELIFKYILKEALSGKPCPKTIKRLWLQSMTGDAIRAGLAQLRDNADMLPLEDAALCRSGSSASTPPGRSPATTPALVASVRRPAVGCRRPRSPC